MTRLPTTPTTTTLTTTTTMRSAALAAAARGQVATTELAPIDLYDVVAIATPRAVEVWLDAVPDARARTDELAELSDEEVRSLVALLDPVTGPRLLGGVERHAAAEVLEVIPPTTAAGLVESLDPDHAAELLRALPEHPRQMVLSEMRLARSAVVRGLLAWPEGSAASRMTPDVATVRPTMTVAEALAAARAQADRADWGEVYATQRREGPVPGEALLGALSFRDLVLADPSRLVADVMRTDLVTTDALADQEEAARLRQESGITALPVVDDGVLLGVLTVDDLTDILEEESTEDAARQGGSQPLDVPYLRATPWLLWRKRVVWMLALFLAEMYTGTVLRAFEDELSTVVALAFFIPLLIGTGGNTGTQVTTTLVRAMATGQVRLRDMPRVLRTELSTGLLIAITIAVVAWGRAWTLDVGAEVAWTVAISAAAIIVWSSLIASVLPLLLARVKIDPAVVSGPMITTLVDGTGLIIYFTVARMMISALSGT